MTRIISSPPRDILVAVTSLSHDDYYNCFDVFRLVVQLLPGLERILGHKPLQKVDLDLKAPRLLVQPGGFSCSPSLHGLCSVALAHRDRPEGVCARPRRRRGTRSRQP